MQPSRLTAARLLFFICLAGLSGCLATLDELARQASEPSDSSPSHTDMVSAIRQALSQGVNNAVSLLGKTDGFNLNPQVRIPVPQDLQKAEELLRQFGQDKYADRFITTLNRAAEQAVPEASAIFAHAIRQMTISDALQIIKGPPDSATQYFQRTSSQELSTRFKPVVQQATDAVGLTRSYKKMVSKAKILGEFISPAAKDIDSYITQEAVSALFTYIAEEEKKIRENPVARSTEILQRVFGFYAEH